MTASPALLDPRQNDTWQFPAPRIPGNVHSYVDFLMTRTLGF